MSSDKKIKKDKEIFLELEAQIKDIKHQLNEQLRCLDQRLENQMCMVWELQDFYQKRFDVEIEYSKNLDKLVKQTMARHKAEKQKREQWQVYSVYKMWQTVLGITLKQSRNHGILGEAYSTIISAKFTQLMEDMQRVYKKCRELAIFMHDELTKVVTELHSSMKNYHIYHNERQQAESKFEKAEKEKRRLEQENKKASQSRRIKNFEKQFEKHKIKFEESNLKALKARNDYLLYLDSANGAIQKFFVDDLPELINVMDYSYHISLGQVVMSIVEMEETVHRVQLESLILVSHKARDLNQRSDRQAFLQQFQQIFSLPKKFEFQSHKGDKVCVVSATPLVREELAERLKTITVRLHDLRLENEEIWKTLETMDSSLLEKRAIRDVDIVALFSSDKPQVAVTKSPGDIEKQNKSERIETEEFYLSKFKDYQLNSNLIARLQAKCGTIENALGNVGNGSSSRSTSPPKRPLSLAFRQTKKRHLGKSSLVTQPKLFGGSIEEYVQATGQEIPSIVRSCIRIINLYGMHHQGVFRVSGSQHEINDFKTLFERGEEPVLSKVDSRDINSIAGVLKLYFRELREPLFPLQLFDELIACPGKYNVSDMDELKKCISRIQELLLPLPRPILVVIRYLFAFLNHLSEYSDENMMDAFNLAVCFGPTLLPIQPDHDQMKCQNHVNELIRILIVHQEVIFPKDGGPLYEKCIVEDDGEDSLDSLLEDTVGDGSEEDVEPIEAVAAYDFLSRNSKELSFHKGDAMLLLTRLSPDWWEGTCNGQTGLVPHKYIAVQGRTAPDKDGIEVEEKLRTSTESLPAKSFNTVPSHPPTVEPLDRSISQPNICGGPAPVSPSMLASGSFTSSDLSRGGYSSCSESLQSLSGKDVLDAEAKVESQPSFDDQEKAVSRDSREQLTSVGSDIGGVSGSSFLDMEPTPNLVLNLPFNISPDASEPDVSSGKGGSSDDQSSFPADVEPVPLCSLHISECATALTNADLFASAGQGTIKKGATFNSRLSVDLINPSSSKEEVSGSKDGSSPDTAGTEDMFRSTFDEIERTTSSLMKALGIGPTVSSSSSSLPLAAGCSTAFLAASSLTSSASLGFSPLATKDAQDTSDRGQKSVKEVLLATPVLPVMAGSASASENPATSAAGSSVKLKPLSSNTAVSSRPSLPPEAIAKREEGTDAEAKAGSRSSVERPVDDKPKPRPPPIMRKPGITKEKPGGGGTPDGNTK